MTWLTLWGWAFWAFNLALIIFNSVVNRRTMRLLREAQALRDEAQELRDAAREGRPAITVRTTLN